MYGLVLTDTYAAADIHEVTLSTGDSADTEHQVSEHSNNNSLVTSSWSIDFASQPQPKAQKEVCFKCAFCPYSSKYSSTMKAHVVNMHDESKLHKCHLCSFTASSKGQLRSHKNTDHTNQKEFVCEHCSASFFQKAHLIKHINARHSKVMPCQ